MDIFTSLGINKVSLGALADRINDSGARVLITMDGAKRGEKHQGHRGLLLLEDLMMELQAVLTKLILTLMLR